jgi:hypothetical protein
MTKTERKERTGQKEKESAMHGLCVCVCGGVHANGLLFDSSDV